MTDPGGLRVRIHATDEVRRRGLTAMLQGAGHAVTNDTPDVELCDGGGSLPRESEAPVVALTTLARVSGAPAGMLAPDATAEQLDLALRAVAAGLIVRSTGVQEGTRLRPGRRCPPANAA